MNSVIHVESDIERAYNEDTFMSRIKDRFRINLIGESFIKDLKISISKVKLPPNFNTIAYMKNMELVRRYGRNKEFCLAPKTLRKLDYALLNEHQRKLFGYSVAKSIQLMLRLSNKSIKSSCIVVHNAEHPLNKEVILEISKNCPYIVLLSSDLKATSSLREYVIANFGISPVVTNDFKFALQKADFIITPHYIDHAKSPVWCIDNQYKNYGDNTNVINDVIFKTPWENIEDMMTAELLGAVLSIMGEKCNDFEGVLKHNGIFIDKIMLNNNKVY